MELGNQGERNQHDPTNGCLKNIVNVSNQCEAPKIEPLVAIRMLVPTPLSKTQQCFRRATTIN